MIISETPIPANAMPFVAPLDTFTRIDIVSAGGKGANLGELIQAGFPVPPGFVLTTAAYEHFVAKSGLGELIAATLSELDDDANALLRVSRVLREAFTSATVPSNIAEAACASYRALGGSIAVRSSATAEDLPNGTFAGQQETYLNVIGEEALLEAVRRCWASLWSERAIAYRRQQGVDQATVKLAVVVQRLIPADIAGVLFTVNPITGARNELVLDASPGLGEAVVAGLVTPDHYVLQKRGLKIKERRAGRREVVIRLAEAGGIEQIQPEATADAPAVPDDAIRELARLGIAIEEHFGAPQDVEWAWVSGRIYVLQTRPITALPPSRPAIASRWWRLPIPNFAGELFPMRPYPLDLTTHTRTILKAVGDAMASPLGIRFPTVERAMVVQDAVAERLSGVGVRPTPQILCKPWLSLWQRRRYDLASWQEDPIIGEAVRRSRALEARDLPTLSWSEALGTLQEALVLEFFAARLRHRYFPLAIRDTALLWLLLRLAGQQGRFGALTSGMENKTLELNRELEGLADIIRSSQMLRRRFAEIDAVDLPAALASEPEAQGFLAAFDAFLRDYGHRESAISLMSQPTWKDAPEIPLGILQRLAASEPLRAPIGQPEWECVRDEVLAQSILGWGPVRRIFLRLLERARRFAQLREDTHFYLTLPMPVERRCVLELGRRLADAGILDRTEDVFFLTLEELQAVGPSWPPSPSLVHQLSTSAAARKTRWEALVSQPFVAPSVVATSRPVNHWILSGIPGSAGVAEGPVRIVRGPDEFGKLQSGDVLVAPFTNPAWTPLFPRLAAVVVDTGAPMSHAAVVAREYGVPAVMGTGEATKTLVDGQRVRVDGTRGLVTRIHEADSRPGDK